MVQPKTKLRLRNIAIIASGAIVLSALGTGIDYAKARGEAYHLEGYRHVFVASSGLRTAAEALTYRGDFPDPVKAEQVVNSIQEKLEGIPSLMEKVDALSHELADMNASFNGATPTTAKEYEDLKQKLDGLRRELYAVSSSYASASYALANAEGLLADESYAPDPSWALESCESAKEALTEAIKDGRPGVKPELKAIDELEAAISDTNLPREGINPYADEIATASGLAENLQSYLANHGETDRWANYDSYYAAKNRAFIFGYSTIFLGEILFFTGISALTLTPSKKKEEKKPAENSVPPQ